MYILQDKTGLHLQIINPAKLRGGTKVRVRPIIRVTAKNSNCKIHPLSELAENDSNNKNNQNSDDGNSYYPICSHPVRSKSVLQLP